MEKSFYKLFEDHFRGSREIIMDRLKIYLPFVQIMQKIYPHDKIIDLGCGRGEWLELLRTNGIHADGVDLDEGMLENAKANGLSIERMDAIDYLKSMPNESCTVISTFHMVEHLSFEVLNELIKESFRVLKPAGILIMETPNPENLKVATSEFYLDHTHLRPIPSRLLTFLSAYYGFERIKVLRLQEKQSLHDHSQPVILSDIIKEVSPDYSIISQKSAVSSHFTLFDDLFKSEYGISMEDLTARFEKRLLLIEDSAMKAEARAN
ncbi:MAG: methyltransferase domain-containing protein, partial [Sulfuricurvum sp.]|nr:methyltransferase domain-containing protein [Sulfuricurvum sp.]